MHIAIGVFLVQFEHWREFRPVDTHIVKVLCYYRQRRLGVVSLVTPGTCLKVPQGAVLYAGGRLLGL